MIRPKRGIFQVKRHAMFLLMAIGLVLAFSGSALAVATATNVSNSDYSIIPSYVVQNVPPNIMILLDNSGSFYNFAYRDANNDCSAVSDPCTGFDPTRTYYGYFNPDLWYQYSSSRFAPDSSNPTNATIGSSVVNPDSGADWDGNFLNWLTMRESDVARKALTGGLCDGSKGCGYNGGTDSKGWDRLVGVGVDDVSVRGGYKQFPSSLDPNDYTPYTNNNIIFEWTDNESYGNFNVVNNGGQCPGSSTCNYNVKVVVPVGVKGVLQDVVASKARIGLATFGAPWQQPPYSYGNGDGANIQITVGSQSLSSVINAINKVQPTSNTPLGEALYEVAGYFGQVSSYFNQMPTGPGPNYTGGSNPTSNAGDDPVNYGTTGHPEYPPCAKNFVLLVTDGEPCEDGEIPSSILSYAAGRSNFVCTNTGSLSNGSLTGSCPAVCSDGSLPVSGQCPAGAVLYPAESSFGTCSAGNTAAGIESVALWMHDGNPAGINSTADDIRQNQPGKPGGINTITLYTVFAFGHGYSSTLLKYASINGGFTGSSDYKPDAGHPGEWTTSSDGTPDNYFEASSGTDLESALKNALTSMLKRASSGTAASVLASGQGSGANLVQAVFYPSRAFGNDVLNWSGAAHDYWFYVDPNFNNSNALQPIDGDYYLTLGDGTTLGDGDDVISFYFDQGNGTTMADRQLSKPDGSAGTEVTPAEPFEDLNDLWEAGLQLWNESPSSRNIYTNIPTQGGIANMVSFNLNNAPLIGSYMNVSSLYNGVDSVIQWTEGYDLTGYDPDNDGIDDYRSRTVDADGTGTYKVWKLGDILNSTPRIVSWMPLNNYDKAYGDTTYSEYINSSEYKSRGTVYAGGNDGMLHAFNMGLLNATGPFSNANTKAQLLCQDGSTPPNCQTGPPLGAERWAFIPENVLPYLQYIAGVDSSIANSTGGYPGYGETYGSGPSYSHIYTVDLTPYVFDASINKPTDCTAANYWDCAKEESSWRTILIGGMRLGGASAPPSANCCSIENQTNGCNSNSTCGSSCNQTNGPNVTCSSTSGCNPYCVGTPATDPNGNPIGYSSYFALDITDENHPKLLWEFTSPNLGFATSGPAIVRISAKGDATGNAKNGEWFVVFGSGPTGPIDTAYNQFLGYSNQDLRYFVLDLATGKLMATIDTGIAVGFSGDLFNATNDSNQNYEDDAIFGGYVDDSDNSGTWDQGGVGRILTVGSNGRELRDSYGNPDPTQWTFSKVIDGIGPVTTSVARLQNNITDKLWLYFGTGRDYYSFSTINSQGTIQPVVDAQNNQNYLVGLQDPCYVSATSLFCNPKIADSDCSSSCTSGLSGTTSLENVDTSSCTGASLGSDYGWYIDLDRTGCYAYPEVIGDPLQVSSSCEQCPVPSGCTAPPNYVSCPGDTTSCPGSTDELYYGAERVITDPDASISGAVYFTTFKPYFEQCGIGGKSFLWAVNYDNGACLADSVGNESKGMALLQVSTGSIQQINLATTLTFNGGRSSGAFEGMPPTAQGLALFTAPPPVRKMLHVREEQ